MYNVLLSQKRAKINEKKKNQKLQWSSIKLSKYI